MQDVRKAVWSISIFEIHQEWPYLPNLSAQAGYDTRSIF